MVKQDGLQVGEGGKNLFYTYKPNLNIGFVLA